MFFDVRLSGAGAMSCATCHDPAFAYGPPNDRPAARGGLTGDREGMRAVPSLRYVDRSPAFAIGPDLSDDDAPHAARFTLPWSIAGRPRKIAGAAAKPPLVPRGGLFWDGRADTLQTQAAGPLLNPAEMANRDAGALSRKFLALGYGDQLARALGVPPGQHVPETRLLDEALFAIARFEFEDASFHPYTSRYDRWLERETTLTAAELRGLDVFENPAKGNCAACHPDRPGRDGRPPLFTDWQYEALGVPRNDGLAANRDPAHVDLGLCGPVRGDLADAPQWCGMFRTPSLRNVATRRAFFHNGVFHSLAEVMAFYNFRDVQPDRVYAADTDGQPARLADLPPAAARNLDVLDPPFDRKRGDPPPMTAQEMRDLIGFLQTLTDQP